MMYASDDDWNEFLLMLEVHKQKKMVGVSALGITK
jgi:hypothetical protein